MICNMVQAAGPAELNHTSLYQHIVQQFNVYSSLPRVKSALDLTVSNLLLTRTITTCSNITPQKVYDKNQSQCLRPLPNRF